METNKNNIWDILGIETTKDEKKIRDAYREKLSEIYEKLEFQKKTYQEYKNVIEFYSKPEFSDMKIIIIDASKSIQEIHEKILSIIKDLPILKV